MIRRESILDFDEREFWTGTREDWQSLSMVNTRRTVRPNIPDRKGIFRKQNRPVKSEVNIKSYKDPPKNGETFSKEATDLRIKLVCMIGCMFYLLSLFKSSRKGNTYTG